MRITVFNVEHGQSSLIETDQGGVVMIDSVHNATTNWRPSTYLPGRGIDTVDRLFITNSDEDHASDLHNLRKAVTISSLSRNPTVTSSNVKQLKNQDVGLGINALCEMLDLYTNPVGPNPKIDDLKHRSYWNKYPEFENENDLSVVTFFDFGIHRMCFTGDMTKDGWLKLLENSKFAAELPDTTIFFASHHGREDGCCEELFSEGDLYPIVTIISDGGIQYSTQETVQWYSRRSRGFQLRGTERRVLTTRCDGNLRFELAAGGDLSVSVGV